MNSSQPKNKSSIKNFIAAFVSNLIAILISLISQKIFINILGTEYLGLNGLFTNVISMLAIIELGMGSAIIYNLYDPIAKKDNKTINSLLQYYKKAYLTIAILTLAIGMLIIPFLPYIVTDYTLDTNIYIVYLLFLLSAASSYLFAYKRSILYADRKNYVISIVHIAYLFTVNIAQLVALFTTKDYYLYLIIKIIAVLLENIILSLIASKQYPPIVKTRPSTLPSHIVKDINKKVRALFFHKIGTFVVLGTDNLVISRYLGLTIVGLYSNYYIIINALNTLFGQAIRALTPNIGHLLVEKNTKKTSEAFEEIRFISFWIGSFAAIGFLLISEPFIKLWLGSEFLLDRLTVIILTFNIFQTIARNTYIVFKDAAGIHHEDRLVPLVESAINIIVSIILVKLIGLPGVFIGTIISSLALWCYSYPKFVYKKLLSQTYSQYAKETIRHLLFFIFIATISYAIMLAFQQAYQTTIIQIVVAFAITLIVPNLCVIIAFRKTPQFKYLIALFSRRKN